MKRRMLVAQALVHKPPVIVLDEPTAGVDVELRQTLWKFIARLNRQGHTVLVDDPLPGGGRGLVWPHCHAQESGRVVALDQHQ
jgi:ABC-2 type transport system ATP-binding protein